MKIEHGAGDFKAVSWTDGTPMWTELTYQGRTILTGLCPTALEDLEYTARRMREAITLARPAEMKPR